jgi:hypothetical protein
MSELEHLFTSTVGNFVKWKQCLSCAHVNETTKFIEREKVQQEKVVVLCFEVEAHETSLGQATNLKSCLEKKIEVTEETAQSTAVARMDKRLLLEKALEDMKEHHQKELGRMCCKFKDNANILGNHIAELKTTIERQTELSYVIK